MSVKPPEVNTKRMTADELRDTFIRFFEKRKHQHVDSASVVPRDKTLLFTSAGMVQFKPYFSGEIDPKEHGIEKKVTTYQKCVRTTDLDLVGDSTHLTFFEMLGNFSFNDYFKKDACEWALDLMENELGFKRERLLFTIHPSDYEAHDVWRGLDVPDERIHRFPDNWWGPVGGEGACGPCSEIHVYMGDMKKLKDNNYRMDPDSGEFIELYNLVFPQFYRERDGKDRDLERRNVDTGMGLERVLTVMSQVDSPYETELFKPMLELIADAAGKSIDDPQYQKPLRVITEHLRAAFFMLADGVIPDNAGQGAVLRNIIRRGLNATSEIGLAEIPSEEYLKLLVNKMGASYPELKEHQEQSLELLRESIHADVKSQSRILKFELVDYRGAIRKHDEAIKLNPNDAEAYHSRGFAKFMLGRYEDADKDFTEAIRLDPRNANAYYTRGLINSKLGTLEDAVRDFTKFIGLNVLNNTQVPDGYYQRGLANYEMGKSEKAKADFDSSKYQYEQRGFSRYESGNYEKAIDDFTDAIRLDPKDFDVYKHRGYVKSDLGDSAGAIRDWEKAIELFDSATLESYEEEESYHHFRDLLPDSYAWIALEKYNLKDYKGALKCLDIALNFAADVDVGDWTPVLYIQRGILKCKLSRYRDAIDDWNKSLSDGYWDDKRKVYCYRGLARYKLRESEGAFRDFYNAMLFVDPSDNNRFDWELGLKAIASTVDTVDKNITKAVELNPDNAEAYKNRGLVSGAFGKYQRAIDDWDKAIELDPSDAETYEIRGLAKYWLGQYDDAIVDYDKAIELSPDDARAYVNRGRAKVKRAEKRAESEPEKIDTSDSPLEELFASIPSRRCDDADRDQGKAKELNPDSVLKEIIEDIGEWTYSAYRAVQKSGVGNKATRPDEEKDGNSPATEDPNSKIGRNPGTEKADPQASNVKLTKKEDSSTAEVPKQENVINPPTGPNKGRGKKQAKKSQRSTPKRPKNWAEEHGKMAFRFHDQLGVSLEDFVKTLGKSKPLSQKEKDEIRRHYEIELERKREHDSGKSKFKKDAGRQVFDDLPLAATEFVEDKYTLPSEIKAIVKDGESVEQIEEGATAMLVFEHTPFYAEKGGQVGDTGYVKAIEGGTVLAVVVDTQEGGRGIYTHKVENVQKVLKVGMQVQLEIDGERRQRIMRNHTGTHLVHAALREVLGHSTRQFGSLVHPDYLRFDFTAPGPVSRENLDKVQAIVNERIRKNQLVEVDNNTTYGQAVKEGALAFFEGKYGEKVRTIKIDEPKTGKTKIGKTPWSYELCGGTHMESTGGIGAFIITGESGVSNGVRRIFALTGVEAEKAIGHMQDLTRRLNMPRFDVGELERKLNTLQKERDDTAERYKRLESRYLKLLSKADGEDGGEEVNYKLEYKGNGSSPLPVQVRVVSQMKLEALRKLGDSMRDKLGSGVVILGSDFEGEAMLVVMATKGSASEQVHAGKLVQRLTASMGGSGGGSQLVGQGGGRDASKLASTLSKKGVTKALKELNA